MKIFYLFVTLAVVAFAGVKAQTKSDFEKYKAICLEESKSSPEEVNKFMNGGWKPEDVTDSVKCHLKCLMEKSGQLKGGQLDEQAVIKTFVDFPNLSDHKQELTQAITECKDEKGANDCDTAYKMVICFKDHKAGDIAITEL